jgi:hypothetical protein
MTCPLGRRGDGAGKVVGRERAGGWPVTVWSDIVTSCHYVGLLLIDLRH